MMKKTATKQWLAVKRLAVNVTALLVTVSLLLSMAGCGPEKAAVDEEKVPKIGFIYETMTVERWQRICHICCESQEPGRRCHRENAYEDSDRQRIRIEMINQGVDVLVIVAFDKDNLKGPCKVRA